ncbi:hypothetical protein JCM10914A_32150 [Paenibacillus sp. JCM 10914]|uniref:DUF4871 domain-containing protein n=1 Tax=Paenibacillus sp. JCM 10914 TaxID=1236974 RepID=UPI0003CC923B|nr:DUF4871 domain-containing protein [Paenibacillus sp. JCM 10914]GAE07802.1 hypothetical protein JCM10914_4048 [Paenibacillus sp. JCM 10914]
MTTTKQSNEPTESAWTSELSSPPFEAPMFTEEMKRQVLSGKLAPKSIPHRTSIRTRNIRWRLLPVGILIILLAGAAGVWQKSPVLQQWTSLTMGDSSDWAPRQVYTQDGVDKIQAFPGGEFPAGITSGAMWMLVDPIETMEGKTIEIHAIHRLSGYTFMELPETIITAEMAYDNFTRVTSNFGPPLAGLWRYDVIVDGDKYGDVVIDVPDGSWEPSPQFLLGNSDNFQMNSRINNFPYVLNGVEGRLGLLNAEIISGATNKHMWYFWGRSEDLTGEVQITAVKKGSHEVITLFEAKTLQSQLNGSDASLHTMLLLPSSGLWRLMATVDGQLFGSVVVDVKSPDG